jgi:hypothetical protein
VKVKVVFLFFTLSLLTAISVQFRGMRKDKGSMEKEAIAESPGGSGRD